MDKSEKIKIIERLFYYLDNPNKGMTDMSLSKECPIYPLEFFDGYIGGLFSDVKPSEIGRPLNAAIDYEKMMMTWRQVKYSEVRGFAKFHSGTIFKNDIISYQTGKRLGITNIYATRNFQDYELISRKTDEKNPLVKGVTRAEDPYTIKIRISVAAQAQFYSELIDNVEIIRGKTKVIIPTHPEATKELLKLRDVPEGKKNRPMIINWISEHTRQLKDSETQVRKHLRGREEFSWLGYKVVINKNT